MARVGKCSECGAAFSFHYREGYPDCPHCGGEMARTAAGYRGPWFSINNALPPAVIYFGIEPACSKNDPNVVEGMRPIYYRYIATSQARQRAAREMHAAEARIGKPGYINAKQEAWLAREKHGAAVATADIAREAYEAALAVPPVVAQFAKDANLAPGDALLFFAEQRACLLHDAAPGWFTDVRSGQEVNASAGCEECERAALARFKAAAGDREPDMVWFPGSAPIHTAEAIEASTESIANERAARGFIGADRDHAGWATVTQGGVFTAPGAVSLVPENIAALLGGPVRLATRATVVAEFLAYLRANGAHIAEYTGGGIEARVSSQIEGFALTELIEGFTRP